MSTPNPSIIRAVTLPIRIGLAIEELDRVAKSIDAQSSLIKDRDVIDLLSEAVIKFLAARASLVRAHGILQHLASLEFTSQTDKGDTNAH